jgi:hypothetical protein
VTTVRRVAMLALGLITIASAAPAFAQTNGDRMSAARAAALREAIGRPRNIPTTSGATLRSMCTVPA